MPQSAADDKPATITREVVGEMSDGRALVQYTLQHDNGLQARFLNMGASLTALVLPDGTNVVARLERPEDYEHNTDYVGCTVGPIANRVADGTFELGEQTYRIEPNEGRNLLHGGAQGYHAQLWEGRILGGAADPFLRLSLFSDDSARGFPSDTWAHLDIRLSAHTLSVDITGVVARNSYLDITTHPYFNPSGAFDRPVDELTLWCPGTAFPVDAEGLPELDAPDDPALRLDDHESLGERRIDNFYSVIAPSAPDGTRHLATLTDLTRFVFVHSDAPGLQVYTGHASRGTAFAHRGAVALEPQNIPNAMIPNSTLDLHTPFRRLIRYRLAGPGLPELPAR